MDYEKKYKEALEKLRDFYRDYDTVSHLIDIKEELANLFPELKESEDERIRKALIRFHKSSIDIDGIKGDEIVAWLEKQGTYTKKDVDDAYVEGMVFAKNELEKQGEQKPIDKIQLGKKYKCIASPRYSTFRRGNIYKPVDNFLCNLMNLCYECFEPIEDSKQKPADKVEPKFKVGDWITNVEVVDAEKKELKKIELNEWVPKKGDVCKPKKGGNNIFLCEQDGIAFSFVEDVKNGCAGGKISIPTLLRDYELVEPKDYNTFDISFNAKDSELKEASYNIPEGFYAEINGNKVIIKQGEQKASYTTIVETGDGGINALVTRELPTDGCDDEQKPAWSEEDEERIKNIISVLDWDGAAGKKENPYQKEIDWLYSLKNRVQPKQEWSEEDKLVAEDIEEAVINYWHGQSQEDLLDWLKSLKERYAWKPSEGQLKCLGYAIDKAEKDWSPLTNNRIYLTLKALKEQLEKL